MKEIKMSPDLSGVPFTLIHAIGKSQREVVSFAETVSDGESSLVPSLLDVAWGRDLDAQGRVLEDLRCDFYDTFEQKQSLLIDGQPLCSLLQSGLEAGSWHGARLVACVWRFMANPPDLKNVSEENPDLTFLVTWCVPTDDIAEAGFSEWHQGKELQHGHLSIDAGRDLFMQFAHVATSWNFPAHFGLD